LCPNNYHLGSNERKSTQSVFTFGSLKDEELESIDSPDKRTPEVIGSLQKEVDILRSRCIQEGMD